MKIKSSWILKNVRADFRGIGERLGIDPVAVKVMANRGFTEEEDMRRLINMTLEDMHAPWLLSDMDKGVRIMADKIGQGRRIRVVSDFDNDGVTSCFILMKGLSLAGADVSYDIPDRVLDGYGLCVRIVEEAHKDGVDTLITCDNGIAQNEAISRAKELGMTVIVTDHHEPQKLPEADAIIDPKYYPENTNYPFEGICGACVAYKYISALYSFMGLDILPVRDELLGFAALGTVVDIMPLTDENRPLVREGLRMLKSTPNIGMQALLQALGLSGKDITPYHCSFIIGPSVNTQGRLHSAKNAEELFLMTDPDMAAVRAERIAADNSSRIELTDGRAQEEYEALSEMYPEGDESGLPRIIVRVVDTHEGLVGLVASKLKEMLSRPVIVFTPSAGDPDILKGSGRSVDGYDMFSEISRISDMLTSFGGHKMAVGLSIRRERLEEFTRLLNENEAISDDALVKKYYIDASMPFSYVTENVINDLSRLEPYGVGFRKPVFARGALPVKKVRVFGAKRNVCEITVIDEGRRHCIKAFNPDGILSDIKKWFGPDECDKIINGTAERVMLDIAYEPKINEFRGSRGIEFWLQAYRRSGGNDT